MSPAPPPKRIIICCDGTWQDALQQVGGKANTNVIKIARALEPYGKNKDGTPIHQVLFYGSGLGSDGKLFRRGGPINWYSMLIACGINRDVEFVQGGTGRSRFGNQGKPHGGVEVDSTFVRGAEAACKIKGEEAYSFLCHNWIPGDEVFFFGFSRGSYTVRMVAGIVGELGIIPKKDLIVFPALFLALQKLGAKPDDSLVKTNCKTLLAPYKQKAKDQARSIGYSFIVTAIGCFDTVGSVGLPEEIHRVAPHTASIFGFSNTDLGSHIQYAYHAMAMNETRDDFSPTKFNQTDEGRQKGQTLRQVWFSGEHSDVGGGWDPAHDLSDLSLVWMVTQMDPILAFNHTYVKSLISPAAPYGQQPPHNPDTGIFTLSANQTRALPTETTPATQEYIHSSVLHQNKLSQTVQYVVDQNPKLVIPLSGFEQEVATEWHFDPAVYAAREAAWVAATAKPTPSRSSAHTFSTTIAAITSDAHALGHYIGSFI